MDEMFGFPLKRDKLYKQVADRIQHLITADSLRPGDKLPGERELAEQMGVSRTVIREAIRVLSDRGLVHVKSGCGTYVRELSHKDAAASFERHRRWVTASSRHRRSYAACLLSFVRLWLRPQVQAPSLAFIVSAPGSSMW